MSYEVESEAFYDGPLPRPTRAGITSTALDIMLRDLLDRTRAKRRFSNTENQLALQAYIKDILVRRRGKKL